jgi:hypothetical protein
MGTDVTGSRQVQQATYVQGFAYNGVNFALLKSGCWTDSGAKS